VVEQIDRFLLRPKKQAGAGSFIPGVMERNHFKSGIVENLRQELHQLDTIEDVIFKLTEARLQAIPRATESDAVVPYEPVEVTSGDKIGNL
jgi:hypothetical protein